MMSGLRIPLLLDVSQGGRVVDGEGQEKNVSPRIGQGTQPIVVLL